MAIHATVQLAGMTFDVVAIEGAPVDGSGRKPSISFLDETRVSFTGGCNRMVGAYAFTWPEGLAFGGGKGFAATRMAGPVALMAQDNALANALLSAVKIAAIDGGRSILDVAGQERVRLMGPVAGTP